MKTLNSLVGAIAGCEDLVPEVRPLASAYLSVLTVAAAPKRVFNELADIENLPRWAGGFCERVYLAHGRWAALTSLGELFLTLETHERAGKITLWAGWSERELHALPLRIAPTDGNVGAAGSRVTLAVPQVDDEGHSRLCRALSGEWPRLVARLGGPALSSPVRRAD